jgi:hypothetical protein
VNQLFRGIENLAINHATVRDHDGEPRFAVVEHNRSRVKWVVKICAFVIGHAAAD